MVSCLRFWESAQSNPGNVHDIFMYITCLEDRYVSGSCVNNIWFLSHLSKPVDISWICSWHCYVYKQYRRQVCWWFLCEIVINIDMYITSVFSICWWNFQRLSCGQLFDILGECWKQSWICSWHCYVYNMFRWQVCWWFLCK